MTEILAIGISIRVNNGAVSSVSLVKCLKVSDVPSYETKYKDEVFYFINYLYMYAYIDTHTCISVLHGTV